MKKLIKTNYDNAISNEELLTYKADVVAIHDKIINKTGVGNDFLGWTTLPNDYDKEEFSRIKAKAEKIRNSVDYLVVIGIGGSYLGAKALIDLLSKKHSKPKILFIGNSFSSIAIKAVYNEVKDKKFAINVISKSGTTLETAIAFRVFRELIEKKSGKELAKDLIIATTDKVNGALRNLSNREGYETFVIPDDIGGRYSVLTPVGLFPAAVAGINIDDLMKGAALANSDLSDNNNISTNDAYKYAAVRHNLHTIKKYPVEVAISYEPSFASFNEWWKQLFAESEGKKNKALFPASVVFSTDLHSLGQFIQDGSKMLFETTFHFNKLPLDMEIPTDPENFDNLNYLTGFSFNKINNVAFEGTLKAHHEVAKIPNVILEIEELNEINIGYFIQFMFYACAMSAYLLGINPFNQPGVEVYKQNMRVILNKK